MSGSNKMPVVTRNESTETARVFWASVARSAQAARERPAWARDGIDLNPENFETSAKCEGCESP